MIYCYKKQRVMYDSKLGKIQLGDRAFPVAAAREWNDLPPTARAPPSLLTFRRDLKIFSVLIHFY